MAWASSLMSGASSGAGASGGSGMGSGLGSMLGGLMGGGKDKGSDPEKIETQNIYGWEVPDLMANTIKSLKTEKPNAFLQVLGNGPATSMPEQQSLSESLSNKMKGTSSASDINAELEKANQMIQGIKAPEMNPFKKNYLS